MNSVYKVIGLMSGTSLDGLDIVAVELKRDDAGWTYNISACETIPYENEIKKSLGNSIHFSAEDLAKLDIQLGNLYGQAIADFIDRTNFKADFISSYGYIIFY